MIIWGFTYADEAYKTNILCRIISIRNQKKKIERYARDKGYKYHMSSGMLGNSLGDLQIYILMVENMNADAIMMASRSIMGLEGGFLRERIEATLRKKNIRIIYCDEQ